MAVTLHQTRHRYPCPCRVWHFCLSSDSSLSQAAMGTAFDQRAGVRAMPRRSYGKLAAVVLAGIHVLLLVQAAFLDSPTFDEVGHLPAGLSHWRFANFDAYRVNPPLVRMVAALPVLIAGPKMDWQASARGKFHRLEFALGADLIRENTGNVPYYFWIARCACIPFSLVGAWVCYRWASDLYGSTAGLVALGLWGFSPNVLGYGHLITPDVGAAACGAAACYMFWWWLSVPTWRNALRTGIVLGLAALTKMTLIVLFGLFPMLWCIWKWGTCHPNAAFTWRSGAAQLGLTFIVAVYVINLGYAFEGSFQRLGEYRFISRTLSGENLSGREAGDGGNRFKDTCFAFIPVPVPKNYLSGIDLQKRDFDNRLMSYLRGEWRHGGWWYYYFYALAVKVPLGTWCLLVLAAVIGLFSHRYIASWRDELVLLAPIVTVLTLVSSQTGFNHHLRYVLPAFPFAFIWISKAACSFEFGHWKLTAIAGAALVWAGGSSLYCYPHTLSYFNELVGGPRGGHNHLLNSNLDWGQDLFRLKHWLEEHPEARGLGVAYSLPPSLVDPADFGIECGVVPYGPAGQGELSQRPDDQTGPLPGWYAVFVNELYGYEGYYNYFRHFEPVEILGYTVYLYCITRDEANGVRKKLGLPEVTATGSMVWKSEH